MKNVLRRAIELLNLLSDNENITTENIKDSISDYRDLNQQAFRRSFERDKNLLRSFGYLIQYENDKWSYDKGYSLSGYSIYESIIKSDKISSEKLINTYLYLKKYLSNSNYDNDKSEIISKILQSINEKRRVGFDYLDKYRKVKPQGLKYFDNKWYLAGEENGLLKTFNLDQIHNLKTGNKADLFQIENKNFPFSWDDEKYSIEDRCRYQICDYKRPTTLLPITENHVRWEFMIKPDDDISNMENESTIRNLMEPHLWRLNPQITKESGTLLRSSKYTFHGLLAKDFKYKNCFLIGDAAHQTPPFLGQGLCQGIKDAYNLVWKINGIDKHHYSKKILDTYTIERSEVVTFAIETAIKQQNIIASQSMIKS